MPLRSPLATKAYVDALLGVSNALVFKGPIDCSTNPNYPAADAGHVYQVTVAGRIGGASGPVVEAGDSITCSVDASASGTHAAVGANWFISQNNIDGNVTPNVAVETVLVIAAGAATPVRASHALQSETGTADALTTLATTNFKEGDTIKLRAVAGHQITITPSGGNISTLNSVPILLDDPKKYVDAHVTATGVVVSEGGAGVRQIIGQQIAASGSFTLFNAATAGKRYRAVIVKNDDPLVRAEIVVFGGAVPVVEFFSETVGALELSNSTTSFLVSNVSAALGTYNIAIEEWF